jgi:hypothetical protein
MTDPISTLIHLRAEMVRIANEVDALADLTSIRNVRAAAPAVSLRLRNTAMTREMVEASERPRVEKAWNPLFEQPPCVKMKEQTCLKGCHYGLGGYVCARVAAGEVVEDNGAPIGRGRF